VHVGETGGALSKLQLVIQDEIFHLHELFILLKHAATYLLIDGSDIKPDDIAGLIQAKLEKCTSPAYVA
jgi:hypothetical protein